MIGDSDMDWPDKAPMSCRPATPSDLAGVDLTQPGRSQWMDQIATAAFGECMDLMKAGRKEYAHTGRSVFENFERVAERLGVSREKVLLVYMEKHLDGIHGYVNGHRSQRESVTGRINDAINYLVLLRGMVEEQGEEEAP